ncbi:MAG: hypothetical protein GX890_05200 [Firmicutes bacterium]|nr:hypothetical protein [Bacillota bacterium]HPU01176.1 nucleoside recognition domain-containing protein [Bacillota bacterium]
MSNLIIPIKSGLTKSLQTLWFLAKIIFPVTCAVQLLEHYHLLERAAAYCSPATSWIGLPGDAVLPLLLGFFSNFYASLGIMGTMSLSSQEVTIMALMLCICHELPIESTICRSTGLKISHSVLLRLITAFLAAFLLKALYTAIGG